MTEIVFLIIFCVPALLGIAEMLHTVKLWLYSSGKSKGGILVIVPTDENYRSLILNSFNQATWYGKRFAEKIIVVDSLLSEDTKEECQILTNRLEIEMCSKNSLCDKVI